MNVIVNKHELIKDHVHRDLLEILEAGVKAANPQDSVVEALRLVDRGLCVYDACYPIRGSIHVVGFGKASVNMALGVLKVLGDLIVGGVVITTEGVNVDYVGRVKVFAGEHPIPGEGTLKASGELLKYLSSEVKNNDLVIVLISGGGSALFEVPYPPLDLKDIAETTSLLMKSGADIVELNTVRKHLSRVKGGRLLEYLSKADKVISLIVSDVVGDEIQYIASGPTTYDTTTYRDSIDVLKRRGVWDLIPEKVRSFLIAGARGEIPETVKPGDPLLDKVRNFVIASNRKSLDAMALKARDLGYSPTILTPFMEGEAREVGRFLASVAKYIAIKERNVKTALLLGGETTVTVKGSGVGGRNQELCVSFANSVHGVKGIYIATIGSDGKDGNSPAAGGICDWRLSEEALRKGLNVNEHLQNNDTYTLLSKLKRAIITGPTGTNVNDLVVIVVVPT